MVKNCAVLNLAAFAYFHCLGLSSRWKSCGISLSLLSDETTSTSLVSFAGTAFRWDLCCFTTISTEDVHVDT